MGRVDINTLKGVRGAGGDGGGGGCSGSAVWDLQVKHTPQGVGLKTRRESAGGGGSRGTGHT